MKDTQVATPTADTVSVQAMYVHFLTDFFFQTEPAFLMLRIGSDRMHHTEVVPKGTVQVLGSGETSRENSWKLHVLVCRSYIRQNRFAKTL